MIKTETLNDGLIRTYSDAGFYIHGGIPEGDYAEAVDPAYLHRIYTETDISIASEDSDDEDEKADSAE